MASKPENWQIIVTGFDSFGNGKSNPVEEIVNIFPEKLSVPGFGSVPVKNLVLETCCSEAWRVLNRALRRHERSQIVLIMTGMADFRYKITLERVALNLRDYRIEDNHGHKGRPQKIDAKLENALLTNVPVDEISRTLARKGVLCDVSNHAGTFVCNETYFKALRYQINHKNLRAALFVHIPLPETYIESFNNGKNSRASRKTMAARRSGAAAGKSANQPRKLGKRQKAEALDLMRQAIESITRQCLKYAGMR